MNFYDDTTHSWCPKWDEIINMLKEKQVKIDYACKNHRPFLPKMIGMLNEKRSKKQGKILRGTWEYYGFESIIWGSMEEA